MNLFLLTSLLAASLAAAGGSYLPPHLNAGPGFDPYLGHQGGDHFHKGEQNSHQGHAEHAQHSEGAQSAEQESGGREGHVKTYHDQGSYSREKHHGYEKAYGYEKETKHHDKGGHAKSFAEGFNRDAKKGHHSSGAHSNQGHASHSNRHQKGGHSGGHWGFGSGNFLPLGYVGGETSHIRPYYMYRSNLDHGLGNEQYFHAGHLGGVRSYSMPYQMYRSHLGSGLGHNQHFHMGHLGGVRSYTKPYRSNPGSGLGNIQHFPVSHLGGVGSYIKPYQWYRSNLDSDLGKFKYLSGMHGLGGFRDHDLDMYRSSQQLPSGGGHEYSWYTPYGSLEQELSLKAPVVEEESGVGPDRKYYYFKSQYARST